MDGNPSQQNPENPAADQVNQPGRPNQPGQPGEQPVYTPAPGVAPVPEQPNSPPVSPPPPVSAPPAPPPPSPPPPAGPTNGNIAPPSPSANGGRQLTKYKIALAVLGLICLALLAAVILQANTIKKNNEAHKTPGRSSWQQVPPAPE